MLCDRSVGGKDGDRSASERARSGFSGCADACVRLAGGSKGRYYATQMKVWLLPTPNIIVIVPESVWLNSERCSCGPLGVLELRSPVVRST